MSHLTFDIRDWRFLLNEYLGIDQLTQFSKFEDFDTDTFDQILEAGVKFAVEEVAATNQESDRVGCEVIDGGKSVKVPPSIIPLWEAYREGGWVAPQHNPEYGGMGLPLVLHGAVSEAMSGANMAFAMYGGLTVGAAHLVEAFGKQEEKDRYCEKMYTGEWGGTMCLTEPGAGSAVGDLVTSATAIDEEAGLYSIEGNKIFISGGDAEFYGNVVHLVLARRKGDPAGIKGISLFIVPKVWVEDDGSLGEWNHVTVGGLEHKMGINGSATCQMIFGDGGTTKGYLLGEATKGIVYMFQMMNEARIACGMQGVSQANAAYQQALAYAKDRKQGPDMKDLRGPSTEIINHPDVRRNLMFMKAYSEGTRSLLAKAAMNADIMMNSADEAEKTKASDALELVTPIAKAYSTDKGFKVTELAIQVFGGYGFTQEYPVEQYMRDIKISSLYEGTNGIQALDLLGRKMRMKGGGVFMAYVMELGGFVGANLENEVLGDAMKMLQKAQGALGEVAFWLQQNGKANMSLAMLQATPFLELFGDVMVGHELLAQAALATEKLQSLCGTATPTKEQREEDTEVAFYAGKIDVAKFFASEVLMWAPSKSRSMTNGNTAALDMVF